MQCRARVCGEAELKPAGPASTSVAALKLLILCLNFFFFPFWWHHVTKSAPCYNHCSSSELN